MPQPDPSPPKPPIWTLLERGGLPPAVLAPDRELRAMWLENYIATYLERDLRELSQVASLGDFHRTMRLAALRTSKLLNVSELARDAGISASTARNYLHLLEVSYQIYKLQPYFSNLGKRLIKSPKLHFRDTGVALSLIGFAEEGLRLSSHPFFPSLIETYLYQEIAKLIGYMEPKAATYFFRTHGGAEVDLVIELGQRILPIEIKSSTHINPKNLHGLKQFLDDFEERAPLGLVIYLGEETIRLAKNLLLVPWNLVV